MNCNISTGFQSRSKLIGHIGRSLTTLKLVASNIDNVPVKKSDGSAILLRVVVKSLDRGIY